MRNLARPARVAALCLLVSSFSALPSAAALTQFFTTTGKVVVSVDGVGSSQASHTVDVLKPSATATVDSAFVLASSIVATVDPGDITLNGVPLTFDSCIINLLGGQNCRDDVTSIVKPVVDAAAAGTIPFTLVEVNDNASINGEILVVVFDDTAATDKTIVLMFGEQDSDGDSFNVTLAEPIDPMAAGAVADFGLGIAHGFQPGAQVSLVDVNGSRLTSAAGGQDDGEAAGGALITVGGLGDSNANPPDPNAPRCRHPHRRRALLPAAVLDGGRYLDHRRYEQSDG